MYPDNLYFQLWLNSQNQCFSPFEDIRRFQNIARGKNCPDITILNFLVFVFLSFLLPPRPTRKNLKSMKSVTQIGYTTFVLQFVIYDQIRITCHFTKRKCCERASNIECFQWKQLPCLYHMIKSIMITGTPFTFSSISQMMIIINQKIIIINQRRPKLLHVTH